VLSGVAVVECFAVVSSGVESSGVECFAVECFAVECFASPCTGFDMVPGRQGRGFVVLELGLT